MNQVCTSCNNHIENPQNQFVTNGLCLSCIGNILSSSENIQTFLNKLDFPILFMQGEPRQVVTANKKTCDLFGKDLTQIADHRGGQVFDCIHSFTEAGCGMDANCENCKIKNAIVDTFTSGKSHDDVQTILDIKKLNGTIPYDMKVSTEKIGDFALIRIINYKKQT